LEKKVVTAQEKSRETEKKALGTFTGEVTV